VFFLSKTQFIRKQKGSKLQFLRLIGQFDKIVLNLCDFFTIGNYFSNIFYAFESKKRTIVIETVVDPGPFNRLVLQIESKHEQLSIPLNKLLWSGV
jgi:hypothetical protein